MGQHVLRGNPPIALNLRQSTRAKRITLRVSGLDGRVTLTLPRGVSQREALDFAAQKEPWLRKHLANRVPRCAIEPGAEVPVHGVLRELRSGAVRSVLLEEYHITLRMDDGKAGPRLRAWLKAQARDRLAAASDHYAAKLGKPYSRITLRDTRSRWGSCTSTGALNYSWRLIMAPPEVLEYVAAHEVAHLAHMNHSSAFWREVTALYGPYEAERRWLKDEGALLHAFTFEPKAAGSN